MYDKEERFFEDKPVPEADIEDIDLPFVEKYINQIGYSKTVMEYLKENKGFIIELCTIIVEVFTDSSVWMGIRKVIEQVNANALAA